MNYVFRVDFSKRIGLGHLVRCLAIQEHLTSKNNKFFFIVGNNAENKYFYFNLLKKNVYISKNSYNILNNKIIFNYKKDLDFSKKILSKINNSIIIVDNYNIKSKWEKEISKYVNKLVVVNDLINRKIYCDILIDQTFGRLKKDYSNFLYKKTKLFVGCNYALLRKQFYFKFKSNLGNSILISMGGLDPKNKTLQVLNLLMNSNSIRDLNIIILLNKDSEQKKNIYRQYLKYLKTNKIRVLFDQYSINSIFNECIICIGAGGVSALERCRVGLPSLVFKAATNQKEIISNMEKEGLIKSWTSLIELKRLLNYYLNDMKKLREIKIKCMKIKIGNKTKSFYKELN